MNTKQVVDDVKRIFGDAGEVAERLREEPEAYEAPRSDDPVVEAARRERERVIGEGINGLDKVAEGREEAVTDDERFGMEAIILLQGRPAILIQGGDFFDPPDPWRNLVGERAGIRSAISRVGRVEVNGHLNLDWVGTGFLVGPDVIMTNRHVAVEFARRDGAGWSFKSGMSSRLDFREEMGSAIPLEFAVTEIIGVHEDHDLALLRVQSTSLDGQDLPDPLPVAADVRPEVADRQVYVIGYPAWDGRRNEPEPMRRIFMDIYNVKRLQPGQIVAFSWESGRVQHDCSTLGGNSGSPVLSLDDHRVVGLHFGGRYSVGNFAVPLWTLVDDPLLRAARVNFQ
jgi:hypothetical protein